MTAPNGTVTNYDYQDPLERLTLAERAVGGAVGNQVARYQYTDTAGLVKVVASSDRYAANDQLRNSTVCYDGFGQQTRGLSSGPVTGGTATILSGKAYDGFGRVSRTFNPAMSANDCAAALAGPNTLLEYDAADRVTKSTSASGAVTEITYSMDETTTKDPAAKKRKETRDALGRLVAVAEDPEGANLLTSYAYDGEGRLITVTQGAQLRSFTYDLAGRLLTANNPESGLISYSYDLNGNLISRQDQRGAIVCYGVLSGVSCNPAGGYDALNRPLTKQSVNAGLTDKVFYCYDGKVKAGEACSGSEVTLQRGVLSSVGNANSDTDYTFDAVGRLAQSVQRTVGLTAKTFTYGYYRSDLRGEILYPSTRRVVTCADGLLRPVWVSAGKTMGDCQAGAAVSDAETYANGVQYAAHGAVTRMALGNGLLERTAHNTDLQPVRMGLGTVGDAAIGCGTAGDEWCLDLGYGTTNNNGNLLTQNIMARKADNSYLTMQQTYAYDALNRLTTFSEASGVPAWGQTNQYDRYGNRWATTTSGVSQAAMTPTQQSWINAANNRVEGSQAGTVVYDPAGNITTHPQLGTMAYDAENRLTSFGAVSTYSYDGEGRRVKRVVGSTTTYYVYDGVGALAAEYGGASSIVGRRYLGVDHLGTTRVTTDGLGTVKTRCDYLPFGDQILAVAAQGGRDQIPEYGCGEPDVTLKFTSKERDAETGLDYFGARYLSSAQGRFTSPDAPFADQHVEDPQSWNLYTYVRNNPLAHIDSDGRACFSIAGFGNTGSGFCQRGETYARFDSMVADTTRFFAAASAATQALADVAVPGLGRAGTSPDTRTFLESTGQALLKVNTDAVNQIMSGQMTGSGPQLDAKMVNLEQTAVQKGLDCFKSANPGGYNAAIKELNGLLNGNSSVAANTLKALGGGLLSSDKAYAQVLTGVRKSLGHDINFANQKDREAIGLGLVKHIRETGGCEVTDNKVHGCK